jgi:hypothetical protein
VNASRVRLAVLICFTLTVLASLRAQQSPAPNGPTVHMIVTVEPRHGKDIPAVDREDVMVYEGKERDNVVEWVPAQGDRAGLEFMILIDDSSGSSLNNQLADIKKFITSQPPTTKIGVAYMQNGIARIEQNLTNDHDLAAKALRLPLGIGGADASPYISLSDLIKHWPASPNRHELLMVSSGVDPYYGSGDLLDPYLDAAIEDSQRAGIIVSAIYAPGAGHFGHSRWLNYWGQNYLSKLSEETGGEAYYLGFSSLVDFTPYLNELAERLNHQYWVGFTAKPRNKAGLQPVKVRTELPSVDLVAPDKVWVPAFE